MSAVAVAPAISTPTALAGVAPEMHTRAHFARRVLDHHRRLKTLALVCGVLSLPGTLLFAGSGNFLAQTFAGRGGDGSRAHELHDVVAALEGSAALRLHAAAIAFSSIFTAGWTPLWLWLAMRNGGARVRARQVAGPAGALVLALVAAQFVDHTTTALRLNTAVASFFLATAVNMWLARLAGRVLGVPAFLRIGTFMYFVNTAMLLTMYTVIPALFFGGSELQSVLLRVLLLPLLLEAVNVGVRYLGRWLPGASTRPTMLLAFANYTAIACFSRLLQLSLRTTWGKALALAGVSAGELLMRVTVLQRDAFYYRLLGPRAQAQARSSRALDLRAELVGADQVAEDLGMLAALGMTLAFRTSATRAAPVVADLVADTAVQLVVEAATDALPAGFVLLWSDQFSGVAPKAGRLARAARRVHFGVDRTVRVWRGRRVSPVVVGLAFTAVAFVSRLYFAPFQTQCVWPSRSGSFWQHWAPCSLTAGW